MWDTKPSLGTAKSTKEDNVIVVASMYDTMVIANIYLEPDKTIYQKGVGALLGALNSKNEVWGI